MGKTVPPIRLRAPEPEDLDVMMLFENDEDQWENGIATGPYSRYQLKQYIGQSTNDLYTDRQLRLMIELPQAGVVGIVDLCSFDPRHNRAEVGVMVLEEYRHRGIASEALRQLEHHCFRGWGFISCMLTCMQTIHILYICLLAWAMYVRAICLIGFIPDVDTRTSVCCRNSLPAQLNEG